MPAGYSLETLTADDFRDVQSPHFRLKGIPRPDGSRASFDVELTEVTEHLAHAPDGARAPFSVLFDGPAEPVMPQGTYRLEHEQLGVLEVFIVPVGPADPPAPGEAPAAMRYEAAFS